MPIYQYNCATCKKRVEVFFRSVSAAEGAEPACPDCGGKQLQRLMSTFARTRSTKQRLDDIDQAQVQARLQTHDLGQFARWAKEAGREYDEDLGTNYRELAERAEAAGVETVRDEFGDAAPHGRCVAGDQLRDGRDVEYGAVEA